MILNGRIGSSAVFQSLSAVVLLIWVCSVTSVRGVPAPARPTEHVRTYRFKARITKNGGVVPFAVDSILIREFTYDLKGRDRRADDKEAGIFESSRNALSFQVAGNRFVAVGSVDATLAVFDHAEHFQIYAKDLELPKGWKMNHESQSSSLILQNVPPKGRNDASIFQPACRLESVH